MNSSAAAMQMKYNEKKTNNKELMIDLWLSVRQVSEILKKLPLSLKDDVNVVYYKERLEQIIDEIGFLNNKRNKSNEENGKYAKLYLELEDIKNSLTTLFPKSVDLDFGNNKELEDTYNEVSTKIEENNKIINDAIEQIIEKKKENPKSSIAKILKPTLADLGVFGAVAIIAGVAVAPTYSTTWKKYSSETNKLNDTGFIETNRIKAKEIIRIYNRIMNEYNLLYEVENDGTSYSDAIEKAEKLDLVEFNESKRILKTTKKVKNPKKKR